MHDDHTLPPRWLTLAMTHRPDDPAWAQFYHAHAPKLRAVIGALARGRTADVEDALQDAWLRLYRSVINGYPPDNPAAWLSTVASHALLTRLRDERRHPTDAVGAAGERPSPDLTPEELAVYHGEMTRLTGREFQCLVLRGEGWLVAEIVQQTGYGTKQVEGYLRRAMQKLGVQRMRRRKTQGTSDD